MKKNVKKKLTGTLQFTCKKYPTVFRNQPSKNVIMLFTLRFIHKFQEGKLYNNNHSFYDSVTVKRVMCVPKHSLS